MARAGSRRADTPSQCSAAASTATIRLRMEPSRARSPSGRYSCPSMSRVWSPRLAISCTQSDHRRTLRSDGRRRSARAKRCADYRRLCPRGGSRGFRGPGRDHLLTLHRYERVIASRCDAAHGGRRCARVARDRAAESLANECTSPARSAPRDRRRTRSHDGPCARRDSRGARRTGDRATRRGRRRDLSRSRKSPSLAAVRYRHFWYAQCDQGEQYDH